MREMERARAKEPVRIARKMAQVGTNLITDNILLNMYAKHARQVKGLGIKAQELIERMESDGNKKKQPDLYSYSALVRIYNRTNVPTSQVAELVDRLHQSDGNMFLDVHLFNVVLNFLAQRFMEDEALEKASTLLSDMGSGVYGEKARPDQISYAVMASGYKNLGTLEAAQRAEEMLDRCIADAAGSGRSDKKKEFLRKGGTADIVFYNTVIGAYVATMTPEGNRRAEELLQRMEEQSKDGNRSIKPNTITYNAVLSSSSAERAQEIFDQMMVRYNGGDKTVKPNAATFYYLLKAWLKSDAPESVERAEEVLRQKDAFQSEDPSVFANIIDYHHVQTKWGKCHREDGPERSEALLEDMISRYESGLGRAAPDFGAYMRVLVNIRDRRMPTAAVKAEGVLDRMVIRAHQNGPKPDRKCFTICMLAWADSGEEGCDAKAEELLNRATELNCTKIFLTKTSRLMLKCTTLLLKHVQLAQ